MAMDWSFFGGTGQDGNFQMNPQLLQMMAQTGAGLGKGQSVGQALGDSTAQALRMKALLGQNPQVQEPTAPHLPGPDQIEEKTIRTADGIKKVTTVMGPSKGKLAGLNYGSSPAPETMASNNGGVSDQSPFFRNLLGQIS